MYDQVSQVLPVQQVDDIDEVHQLDPVHQVDHKDEHTSHHIISHHIISYHITSHHITYYKHNMSYHNIGLKSDPFSTFSKSSGDRFFDPESLSIDLLVMVPDFFELTFDISFSESPKWSKFVKNGQKNVLGSAA